LLEILFEKYEFILGFGLSIRTLQKIRMWYTWDTCSYLIISSNIQSGELEVIDEMPYEDKFCFVENVFEIKLPWWPRLVSTCTECPF
jgi:hypothetical protein